MLRFSARIRYTNPAGMLPSRFEPTGSLTEAGTVIGAWAFSHYPRIRAMGRSGKNGNRFMLWRLAIRTVDGAGKTGVALLDCLDKSWQ